MDHIQMKRNAPVAELYEDAVKYEGAIVSSTGALINFSGKKTGRSPKDKRIVYEETSKDDIWWGSVNIKMDERTSFRLFPYALGLSFCADTFEINRERAIDYLNTRDNVYVFDGFAGVGSRSSRVVNDLLCKLVVGSQIPYQSSGDLRSRLSRSLHGSLSFPRFWLPFTDDHPEQYVDPPDGRTAGKLWRARLYHLQRGSVPCQSLHQGYE